MKSFRIEETIKKIIKEFMKIHLGAVPAYIDIQTHLNAKCLLKFK